MKAMLTKKQIPRRQFIMSGVIIAALVLTVASILYWHGQSLKAEANGIRCEGSYQLHNTSGMIETPVYAEGKGLSPSISHCSIERWKKLESGKKFIEVSYILAASGIIVGLGLTALLWPSRDGQKTAKRKSRR